jgi:two-component system sensor histidine kinase UhpB
VVQESLSNAMRHANPTRVDIRVEAAGEGCEITIEDDGIGMPPGINPKGLGLLGMRERVNALGGRLRIASSTGSKGVAVHAMLGAANAAMTLP